MNIVRKNWALLLTAIFSIVVGVLLLVNPVLYAIAMIKVAGALLVVLGIIDIVKYFRTDPQETAKESAFYSGSIMIAAGVFCLFESGWFVGVFPVLAVLYGLFQILIGFRKLQRMVDALRAKQKLWYLKAISSGMTLLFGFLIIFNPGMTMMSIWVFTGVTLIIEGILDASLIFMQVQKRKKPENDIRKSPSTD